jgi:prevent-host-death family protein
LTKTVSTIEIRKHLGDILNRVALRHDQYIIERKGRPLAAVVPVEKLEWLEKAAQNHLLTVFERQKSTVSQKEADQLADEAKHKARARKRKRS